MGVIGDFQRFVAPCINFAGYFSMKLAKKTFSISFVLLAFIVTTLFFGTDTEARSSKKQISNITSIHKFQPGAANFKTGAYSNQTPIINIFPEQQIKQRSDEIQTPMVTVAQLRKRLTSRSAIIMDSDSGDVIYSYAADMPAQPASTIKILTGLIAIQSLGNAEWVFASLRAANMPRSKVYLRRGKSYRADDMINAVLLSSANDASVALAEKIAGSERVFAKLMTHKAKAWGAENTICKTATGLTARGQKSTVRDLAVLFNKAMDNDEFASRVARTKVKTGYGTVLKNHNRALWQIDGTEGGKTGYTNAARQTYVGKFKRYNDELTVAVMGSETMWDDVKHLVEYGFAKKRSMERTAVVVN
jgi:D-alanyl-D-alanine carboxypeptidase (penicillin-binding protein 5/6)